MEFNIKEDIIFRYFDNYKFEFVTLLIKAIFFVIGIISITTSRYAFTLLMSSMLPSIIAILIDRKGEKCMSASICGFNLIGVMPHLISIWKASDADFAAKAIISNPRVWVSSYLMSIIGIALYFSVPFALRKFYAYKIGRELRALMERKEEIHRTWDL